MNTSAPITRLAAAALAATFAAAPSAYAGEIDFEGLLEGQVIKSVSNGSGANGLPNGSVTVSGFNPQFGVNKNAAIVYASHCPATGTSADCSGQDQDLGTPNQTCGGGPGIGVGGQCPGPFQNDVPEGNIAIVAERFTDTNPKDGLVDNPDDADSNDQFIEFNFQKLSGPSVTVNSIKYIDNDEGEFNAELQFFGPGTLNPSVIGLTAVGDNGVNTLAPGIEGVTLMRVVLDGSGGVASVVVNEEIERTCWVTTGGFEKGEVFRDDASGKKVCTFGGNVGPPPSGAFEVNWHDGPLAGQRFHTNDIDVVTCEDRGTTGPGQPGAKKGLGEDTLLFDCTGKLNNQSGFTCDGFLQDGGEPGGKNGNDPDRIQMVVYDSSDVEVARCEGILSGGNVQIHPPVGKP